MLGDIVSMNTLEEMSFSVTVTLSPLVSATLIVNVAYDSLGVDGIVTVASYMAPFTVALAFNPSIWLV